MVSEASLKQALGWGPESQSLNVLVREKMTPQPQQEEAQERGRELLPMIKVTLEEETTVSPTNFQDKTEMGFPGLESMQRKEGQVTQ